MLWNSTSLSDFRTNLIFNGADWSGLVLNDSAISVWTTLLAQPACFNVGGKQNYYVHCLKNNQSRIFTKTDKIRATHILNCCNFIDN